MNGKLETGTRSLGPIAHVHKLLRSRHLATPKVVRVLRLLILGLAIRILGLAIRILGLAIRILRLAMRILGLAL